jgi:hypothetical protein
MNKKLISEIIEIKKQMGLLNEESNINTVVKYLMSLKFPKNHIEEYIDNQQFYMKWLKNDYKIEIRGSNNLVDVNIQISPISNKCSLLKTLVPTFKKYSPDIPFDKIYGEFKNTNFCFVGGLFKNQKMTSLPFDKMIIELLSKL